MCTKVTLFTPSRSHGVFWDPRVQGTMLLPEGCCSSLLLFLGATNEEEMGFQVTPDANIIRSSNSLTSGSFESKQ